MKWGTLILKMEIDLLKEGYQEMTKEALVLLRDFESLDCESLKYVL